MSRSTYKRKTDKKKTVRAHNHSSTPPKKIFGSSGSKGATGSKKNKKADELAKKLATQKTKKAIGDVITNTFRAGLAEMSRAASTIVGHGGSNDKNRISPSLEQFEDTVNARRLPPPTPL